MFANQKINTLSLKDVRCTLKSIWDDYGNKFVVISYEEDNKRYYPLRSVEYDNQHEVVKITIDTTKPCNLDQINPLNN